MSQQKIVKSPNADVSKDELTIIAEATTLIKSEITNGVFNGLSKKEIYGNVAQIIGRYAQYFDKDLESQFRRAMSQMTIRDYTRLSMNSKTILQNFNNQIPGYNVTNIGQLINLKDAKERGVSTDRRMGQPTIPDYQMQVRDELKVMASQPALFTTIKNGKPSKMSLRNKAEMAIRYEANLEDVKRLKDEGVDLVWISSHVDCSMRCQPWQGKLYSISGENAGKTIEGNKVLKLSDALKGVNNDGNGCINGYNCRHYLIEYKKGSVAPKEYDAALIKKESEINTQQRLKENQIRQIKTQEVLAKKSGDKELAKKLNLKWHKLEKKYEIYSLKNGRPYYPWRTRVMRDEPLQPNKWGDGNNEKAINRIEKNIEEKSKEQIEYKVGVNFSAPEKLYNIANISKDKLITIRFRQRGDKDTRGNIVNRGASRHILDDHLIDINDEFLNKMRETLLNPDDVISTKEAYAFKKFLYTKEKHTKYEDKYLYVVLQKEDDEFLIFSTYIKTFKRKK